MIKRYNYHIAGLMLEIRVPREFVLASLLPSFEPFFVECPVDRKIDCSIELAAHPSWEYNGSEKLLSDVSEVWGERFRFYEQEDDYTTTIQSEQDQGVWKMKSNKDFSQSIIYLLDQECPKTNVLSWLVMMTFGQTCLLHKVILIHASTVMCNKKGYVFLGKSGTGKSTHSRLWLENIEGAELINDDNPAIKLESNGEVHVYGTPWSGKTACYKNVNVQVQAIVRLNQATCNHFSTVDGLDAFVCVMPSCTAIRWNKRLFGEMNNTLEAIVQKVLVAELDCLANREAALYCHNEILNYNTNYKH